VLDACVYGIGNDRDSALQNAAFIWITCVAGPIKSFLDDRPVCMTCQAGVSNGDPMKGYSRGAYGLPKLKAYVGPSFARGLSDDSVQSELDDTKPWFRFAAESAAPRRVHLAKVSILSKGKEGWTRDLEIDGHEVSYHEPQWPAGVSSPDFGYLTRFAVFEFPPDSPMIARRAETDRTIRNFAENYSKHESVDQLMEAMAAQGFDKDLIHQTESISTIAFSRALFEPLGVKFSATIIRARRDGRIETDVPLMSIPSYSRARALAVQFRETMSREDFQSLCCYNAEAGAILQAIEAGGDKLDLTQLEMFPCVVADRGVTMETMDNAIAALNQLIERKPRPDKTKEEPPRKKRWWQF
jgi:hypothetical protein